MEKETFRSLLKNLQKLAKEHPELLDKPIVTSSDDEGNSYNYVYYTPTPFVKDGKYDYAVAEDVSKADVICIN